MSGREQAISKLAHHSQGEAHFCPIIYSYTNNSNDFTNSWYWSRIEGVDWRDECQVSYVDGYDDCLKEISVIIDELEKLNTLEIN